jgi:hypothetical protein
VATASLCVASVCLIAVDCLSLGAISNTGLAKVVVPNDATRPYHCSSEVHAEAGPALLHAERFHRSKKL